MSIALVLTLCTALGCNAYTIDTLPTAPECQDALVAESDYLAHIWQDVDRVELYTLQFGVIEPVAQLTDYDYTCEPVGAPQWVSK